MNEINDVSFILPPPLYITLCAKPPNDQYEIIEWQTVHFSPKICDVTVDSKSCPNGTNRGLFKIRLQLFLLIEQHYSY